MGAGLLLCVAVVYAVVAMDYAWKSQHGMALAFAAYALANVGFAIDAR